MSEISNLQALRIKYLNGNRGTKDQILTSLCLVHGYHRKSAIRLMHGELRRLMAQKSKRRKKPGVKSRYQEPGFKAALKAVWRETDYMCSKNLKKAMPIWLPAYEAVEGAFREDIRIRLLSISAASIDRVLKPPYQRVLQHPLVDEHQKERLRNIYISINPVLFKKQIFSQLRSLLKNASVTSQFESSEPTFGNNLI